jgi:predicted nucleic acid-binding protein
MPEIIIADTSCFILLTKIKQLDLLKKLYGTVITTNAIATEFGKQLPDWVIIQNPIDEKYQYLLSLQVDKGEASAITLALEDTNSTIILDDLKARKLAKQLNISITGTLGIIVKAKQLGIIPSIKPLINKIRQTNFRITPMLEKLALKESGE